MTRKGKQRASPASHGSSQSGNGRERVLADHVPQGKRLIPPMLRLPGELREVSWVDCLLPELLWIAILEAQYGQVVAADLSLTLAKVAARTTGNPRWFGTTSSFQELDPDDWTAIRGKLDATAKLEQLCASLDILTQHYPECPFQGLYEPRSTYLHGCSGSESLVRLSELVAGMVDRSSARATFAQGCIVYFGLCLDRLVVHDGLTLANLPELQNYPRTELSQRVASAVRAVVNQCASQPGMVSESWARYFWNRGLELTSCTRGDE